jgi:hypothetical protein
MPIARAAGQIERLTASATRLAGRAPERLVTVVEISARRSACTSHASSAAARARTLPNAMSASARYPS